METYCLDTNFFIEGWNKYYSPDFCSNYWNIIAQMGEEGIVFIPREVYREIEKEDDAIKDWLNEIPFMIREIDDRVQKALRTIYDADQKHKRLVDTKKGRSIADPWVIAHAMAENAIVVTKENKITQPDSSKIQIPNVCENMGVQWLDDFAFIRKHNIKFTADKH